MHANVILTLMILRLLSKNLPRFFMHVKKALHSEVRIIYHNAFFLSTYFLTNFLFFYEVAIYKEEIGDSVQDEANITVHTNFAKNDYQSFFSRSLPPRGSSPF